MRIQQLPVGTLHAIGTGSVLALTMLAWTLIGRPVAQSAAAASDSQREALRLASEVSELSGKAVAARKRSESLTQEAQNSAAVLRSADSQNERLAAFSKLAAEYGLTVREITQDAPKREARVVRVLFKVKGTGTFAQCVSFLEALKASLPDFAVRSLELKGNAEIAQPRGEFLFETVWFGRPA
jgi:hypothetical protein